MSGLAATDYGASPSLPRTAAPSTPRWFWLLFAVLCIAKLVLVSHEEIRTYGTDDEGWAKIAHGGYWGNAYGPYTHMRQPVYPVFLALCAALGLPVRIGIELVWFACAGLACHALRACGMAAGLRLAAAALIVFHPWATRLMDRLVVDTLYAPVFTVLVLAAAAAVSVGAASGWRGAWRWGVLAGASGALAANIRPEAVLVLATLGLAGAVTLVLWGAGVMGRRHAAACIVCAVIGPWAITTATDWGLRRINQRVIGAAVTHDFDLPGYQALLKALMAIPPEKPDLRLPAPADARRKAAAISPAFARIEKQLNQHPEVTLFMGACERTIGIAGEYGAWTCWGVRRAGWAVGEEQGGWKDAGELDAFYAQAAREIRGAMATGKLESRWAPSSFLPPEWGQLSRTVPSSLRRCLEVLLRGVESRHSSETLGRNSERLFDEVALRREALKSPALAGSRAGWWYRSSISAGLEEIKAAIGGRWPAVSVAAAVLAVAGGLVGLVGLRRRWLGARWYVLYVLLAGAIAGRVVLVALLDVTSIRVQSRYLLTASVLGVILGLLGLQGLVFQLGRALKGRRAGGVPGEPGGSARGGD